MNALESALTLTYLLVSDPVLRNNYITTIRFTSLACEEACWKCWLCVSSKSSACWSSASSFFRSFFCITAERARAHEEERDGERASERDSEGERERTREREMDRQTAIERTSARERERARARERQSGRENTRESEKERARERGRGTESET